MLDRIHHNAELVQSVAHNHLGVEVGFDRAAVEWLDGYVTRQHDHGDPDNVKGLVSALGSFLGECIVQTYGGEWVEDAHDWGIRFDEQNAVFPYAKVEKHLRHGPEDSLLSFFDTIPVVFGRGG
ncbi:MAG: hypothetical protein AAF170_16660 [Bacteroidota bacterium]